MAKMTVELKGGKYEQGFTCTGCEKRSVSGDEGLEMYVMDRIYGPLCVDCWPKVPAFLEQIASNPGISIDTKAIAEQVMARYRAARSQVN